MSGGARLLMAAELLLFLLPATGIFGLMTALHFVAYPLPQWQWVQALFDLALLLTLAGVLAAWRLGLAFVAGSKLGHRAPLWRGLLSVALVIGILAAAIAVEQFSRSGQPQVRIGFALLAPAILLLPIWIQLWWHERGKP